MLEAYVSGTAARALFVQGNESWFVDVDDLEVRHSALIAAVPRLLHAASDVIRLKNTTEQRALEVLLSQWKVDRAVRLFDLLLDEMQSTTNRIDALDCLEEFLQDEDAKKQLQYVLYAVPCATPISLDVSQANFGQFITFELLADLARHQDTIAAVREQWDNLSDSAFSSSAHRRAFELAAITSGVFFLLSHREPDADVNNILFDCYLLLKDQPNYRQVVNSWTSNLRTDRKRRSIARAATGDDEESVEFQRPRKGISVHALFQNVNLQKDGIVQQLRDGHTAQARRFAQHLIRFQLLNGNPRFAAKSLCSLAADAKRFGELSLELEWLLQAVEIAPDDSWTHGQAGDAYLNLYRYEEASKCFDMCGKLGGKEFAAGGHARLLKASGQLALALKAFEDAKNIFADHEEAYRLWAGYSEVLRDMGDYSSALAAYDDALRRFPNQPAIWCGKAATLADLGRLNEAKDLYGQAIERFAEEPTPYGGHAALLSAQGRFAEALALYEAAMVKFPEESILVCGRAETLASSGNLPAALTAYQDAKERFPFLPLPFTGYADTLRFAGRNEEALAAYSLAIDKFKLDARCRTSYANALRALGMFDKSLAAFERSIADFPYDCFGLNGRAKLLKELGSYNAALEAYDLVLERLPHYEYAQYGKAALLAIMGKFEIAQKLLPASTNRTRASWIGTHVAGMIKVRQRYFDEALALFTTAAEETPFFQERGYFENAIAVTKLALGRYEEALAAAQKGHGQVAQILVLHSHLALGHNLQASATLRSTGQSFSPLIVELKNVLAAKYNMGGAVRVATDESWIVEREVEALLQAA